MKNTIFFGLRAFVLFLFVNLLSVSAGCVMRLIFIPAGCPWAESSSVSGVVGAAGLFVSLFVVASYIVTQFEKIGNNG